MIKGFRMDNKITCRVEAQECVIENRDKEFMFEQLSIGCIYTNKPMVKVYKVTNSCGQNHLTTFSYDRAWDMYVERLAVGDYPTIELIEVEE